MDVNNCLPVIGFIIVYAIAGGFFGTLIYGLLNPVIDKMLAPSISENSNP